MEQFAKTVPGIRKGFLFEDRTVNCIDEGTPGGLNLAGSGILLEPETAVKYARAAQADGVCSHEECGAAKLYAKKMGLDPSKSDKCGIQWAKKLAKMLGVPYRGHISIRQMKRPSGLHVARVTYYDGTGRFCPENVKGLPPGFVISRKFIEADYAAEETGISISIATGDHGFGHKITKKDPFIIVVVGDPHNPNFSVKKLEKEAVAIAKKHGGKVVVDGFTAPL